MAIDEFVSRAVRHPAAESRICLRSSLSLVHLCQQPVTIEFTGSSVTEDNL